MMKKIILSIEKKFDHFVSIALKVYASPFTFFIACILVVIYLLKTDFRHQSIHKSIGNIITCITFLIFFLIQKSVNRYSLALQMKLNELLVSHDTASNEMVHAEHKTETELKEISEKYLKENSVSKSE